ncbi:MAG: site-2 protease family protein [Clostridia bacterium]|nr:site-2 protease family protein [Clostridia bacterium]
MLLDVLYGGGSFAEKLLYVLIMVIALLPALTFHEWAHGYAAYKLGDHTAKADGRLSLNPLDHLDPVGTVMLLVLGFGWAKPVPVMTRNFKKPRRDFAITSLAGPMANFVVGFITTLLYVLGVYICAANEFDNMTAEVILSVFLYSSLFNFGLGLFNLIPLPPLDGSNVVMCLLPNRIAAKYSKIRYYSRYIFIGLIVMEYIPYLEIIPQMIFWPISVGRDLLFGLVYNLGELIFEPIFFG